MFPGIVRWYDKPFHWNNQKKMPREYIYTDVLFFTHHFNNNIVCYKLFQFT